MAFEQLSATDRQRLKDLKDSALRVFQELEDLKGGLKDTVKTVAEEFDMKPAILMKWLRTEFKNSLEADKEVVQTVENLMDAVNH